MPSIDQATLQYVHYENYNRLDKKLQLTSTHSQNLRRNCMQCTIQNYHMCLHSLIHPLCDNMLDNHHLKVHKNQSRIRWYIHFLNKNIKNYFIKHVVKYKNPHIKSNYEYCYHYDLHKLPLTCLTLVHVQEPELEVLIDPLQVQYPSPSQK